MTELRYRTYTAFHIPTARLMEQKFTSTYGFDVPSVGLTELEALRCLNLWNQGTHHDYRYWL